MDCNIRKAEIADYSQLKRVLDEGDDYHREILPTIFKDPLGNSWKEEYVQSLILNDESEIIVAELENQIIGVLVMIIKQMPELAVVIPRKYPILDNVSVKREFRGQGIGRKLITEFENWARNKGYNQVELNVWESNIEALKLYENLGFKTLSRRLIKNI